MTCRRRTAFPLSLPLLAALALAACGRPERLPEPAAPPAGTALKADLPPAYDEARLIEIEQPRDSTVRIGIAPETISVDAQAGVVRYVAVMRGISARVATYEGIRCNGGQWRVFARRQADGPWLAAGMEWEDMYGPRQQPYVQVLARDGMCIGPAVNTDVRSIVRGLQSGGRNVLYRG